MINLIINELKKIISKKRFFMMFIIMFLITALSIYSTGKNTTSDKLTLYQEVKSTKLQFSLTNGRKQKAESNRSVKNEELISHLNNQLEILEQERELLSKLDKTGSDWRGILKEDIDLIEKKKYFAEKEGEKNVIEDINKELIYKKFFLENNVRYTNKPSTNAFYNMPSVLYYMQRLFLLMIISILVLDIVSGENEAATIKALLTKPVSRGKVLLSKFIAVIIATNGIVLALQGMAFLILGMFFTFGDPNTPFVVGTKYNLDYNLLNQGRKGISAVIGSSSVLPAWEVIVQLILLQILLITTCVAFCILISTIFKSNVAATGTGFFFLVISWIVAFNATDVFKQISGRTTLTQKIVPYFFETYYDLFALLTGSLSQALLNPNATVGFFISTCFVWSIFCYGITHIIFTRRDIL